MEHDDDPAALALAAVDALRDDRLDEALGLWARFDSLEPDVPEMLVVPVLVAIQRGQLREALQFVNGPDGERCPQLRALCLYLAGEPSWHGCATALLEHADEPVRLAMRSLLDD